MNITEINRERYTVPAKQVGMGNVQKRLRYEFDDHTELRWNQKDHIWVVYHRAPFKKPYVVGTWVPQVDVGTRIVYDLLRRQKSKRQLVEEYEAMMKRSKQREDEKIQDLSRETAELADMHRKGKVVTSGRS